MFITASTALLLPATAVVILLLFTMFVPMPAAPFNSTAGLNSLARAMALYLMKAGELLMALLQVG